MSRLVLKAYVQLIRFDFHLTRRNFAILCDRVRKEPLLVKNNRPSADELCHAVDVACIWYCKQVLCLQRSAATACLLKNYGFGAEMVIGAQQMAFKAHAWVEINGRVVNDRPYIPDVYAILDRC